MRYSITCESGVHHVYRKHHKRCDCGEKVSPIYRTWWQRIMDRIERWKAAW